MHDGCTTSDHRRAIGRLDGVIDAILSAMRTHSDVAGVQKRACSALWNLAVNDGTTSTWRAPRVKVLVLVLTVCRA